MRIYRLSNDFRERVMAESESGMGFLHVRITWKGYRPERPERKGDEGYIASGNLLVALDPEDETETGRGTAVVRDYEADMASEADRPEGLKPDDVEFAFDPREEPKFPFDDKGAYAGKLPIFYQRTHHGDEFRRLSSSQADWRIDEDGSVAEGTFATTVNDLRATPSGLAAVGRYALPIKLPASYVYHIIPPPNTLILYSTVRPAYGFPGGGVEVYFPNGCPPGSAKLLSTLPEL